MTNSSPEKMYAVFEAAEPHVTTINNALGVPHWDAKIKKEVKQARDVLKGMMNTLSRYKSDNPAAVDAAKDLLAKANDKLAGREVKFEEYIEPDTTKPEKRLAA